MVKVKEGATVAELLESLRQKLRGTHGQEDIRRGIAVSVNAEYATAGQVLREGSGDFLIHDETARELYLGRGFRM